MTAVSIYRQPKAKQPQVVGVGLLIACSQDCFASYINMFIYNNMGKARFTLIYQD
jgi:hypothetical protein